MTTSIPLNPSASFPRGLILLLGIGVGALSAWGAQLLSPKESAPAKAAAFQAERDTIKIDPKKVPFPFETAAVELGSPLPRNPCTARVATIESRTAPSYAPLDGRVAEVAVRIGDRVKEGDKLLLVRSGDLASMQREQKAAKLSIETKQALVDRLRLLVEARAASQNELLVAQSELNEAKLVASAASARLRSLSVRQQGDVGYWVLATRSGTLVQLDAAPGRQVGPDKDHPVATVADLDEVLVVVDVPQRDAASLVAGVEAQIQQPGTALEPSTGKIEGISDVVDAERQTVPVRVRADNQRRQLKPNSFVEVTFSSGAAQKLILVPSEAVVSDGVTSVVFVEVSPGVLKRRPVRVGRQARDRAEILDGLSAGERVVVRGALLLLNAIDFQG